MPDTTHLIDIIRKVTTMTMDEMLQVQDLHDELMAQIAAKDAKIEEWKKVYEQADRSRDEWMDKCAAMREALEKITKIYSGPVISPEEALWEAQTIAGAALTAGQRD